MSYKIKAYVNARNKKDSLDIGYTAGAEKFNQMIAGAIPHIMNDAFLEYNEMEGSELKITIYIAETGNVKDIFMEKKYKEYSNRKF